MALLQEAQRGRDLRCYGSPCHRPEREQEARDPWGQQVQHPAVHRGDERHGGAVAGREVAGARRLLGREQPGDFPLAECRY